MTSLPKHYASPMHLPFNRACLSEQFVLQGPGDDPGGPGCGVLLCGSRMLVAKDRGNLSCRMENGSMTRRSISVDGRDNLVA